MNYYLAHFSGQTWKAFQEHGSSICGFPQSATTRAAKVRSGDIFLCYLIGLQRWIGATEVLEGPYVDRSPVFSPANDMYVVRFRVKSFVALSVEDALPSIDLWEQLNRRTSNPPRARAASLRTSLASINSTDGPVILNALLTKAKMSVPSPSKPRSK